MTDWLNSKRCQAWDTVGSKVSEARRLQMTGQPYEAEMLDALQEMYVLAASTDAGFYHMVEPKR